MSPISNRLRFISDLSKQPFIRLLLAFWAASGVWDLALSEWIPEEYAKHLPRVYQVVAMTTGLLSWQIWVMAGITILAFASLEYAFRKHLHYLADSDQDVLSTRATSSRLLIRNNAPAIIGTLVLFGLAIGITVVYYRNKELWFPSAAHSPQSVASEPLISTAFRKVFKCAYARVSMSKDEIAKEHENDLAYFRERAKLAQELYGITATLTDDQETSSTIELSSSDPLKFAPAKKLILVVFTYDFGNEPEAKFFELLGLLAMPEDPKVSSTIRETIEKMAGFKSNTCRLI